MAALAGLLLLTLVLRIAIIVLDGDRLYSDPDAYVRLATMLADGQGFSTADGIRPTAYRPVLYPLLLAIPLKLGLSAPTAVVLWNLVSGLTLVLATIGLAKECALHRRVCLLAGLLAAADPLMIRYTTEPMTENLCAALLTLSLLLLLRFVRTLGVRERPGIWATAIGAGTMLGLSALCRPVVLVSCVLLTLTLVVVSRSIQTESRSMSHRLVWVFFPAVVAAVTVSPWIIRNAFEFNALIPATTHGGYTLLLGNNSEFYDRVVSGMQPAWDGESLVRWQKNLGQQMTKAGVDQSDERAADQWMYRQAIREIGSQPGMAARAVLLRWKRFWAITPITSGTSLSPIAIYGVAAWYALAGIGLLSSLLRLRRNPAVLLLWVTVVSFVAVHSVYWTNTRMRAPLTGILIVLAITGWKNLTSSSQPADAGLTAVQ